MFAAKLLLLLMNWHVQTRCSSSDADKTGMSADNSALFSSAQFSSNCKFNREHGEVQLRQEVARTNSLHNVRRESGRKREGVEKSFEAKIETHNCIRASDPGPKYMRMGDRKRALRSEQSDMKTYLDWFC